VCAFQFRFSRLLRLRENVRNECRQNLATAQKAEDVIQTRVHAINNTLTDLRSQAQAASRPGQIDIDRLLNADRYEATVAAQLQTALQQRKTAAAEVEHRREELIESDREVKTLEKLHQHQAARHGLAENRREVKQLDEATAQQASRQANT
jgi:flagellar export protein FliJ